MTTPNTVGGAIIRFFFKFYELKSLPRALTALLIPFKNRVVRKNG